MSAGSMVSGRIATELKRQGDTRLQEIGETPSRLIRAAYEYVIHTGELPSFKDAPVSTKRKLTKADKAALNASIAATTVAIPATYFEGKSDKELLEEALMEKYGEGMGA